MGEHGGSPMPGPKLPAAPCQLAGRSAGPGKASVTLHPQQPIAVQQGEIQLSYRGVLPPF